MLRQTAEYTEIMFLSHIDATSRVPLFTKQAKSFYGIMEFAITYCNPILGKIARKITRLN
jgi:hypothetical protein